MSRLAHVLYVLFVAAFLHGVWLIATDRVTGFDVIGKRDRTQPRLAGTFGQRDTRRAIAVSDAAHPRLPVVDIARGIAVFGMFGYHLTWDLANSGFIDPMLPFSVVFRLYSHVVASAFVGLAGVSLVLGRRIPFRWDRWAKHIAKIVAAAALVTLASYLLFPEGLIGFGILHCIAAALVVATPFLFLPPLASVVAALAIAAAPLVVHAPTFNVTALIWTGLGTIEPSSNDYRAFFPWAAPALAGLGLMAMGERHGWQATLGRWQPVALFWRMLAFCGRHSLAIYLIHQPLFFGALAGIAALAPPSATVADRTFTQPCERRCEASGAPSSTCQSACACVAGAIRAEGLDGMLSGAPNDADQAKLSRVTQACLRAREPD